MPFSIDVLYNSFIAPEKAKLGRLFTSIDDPSQEYAPQESVVDDATYIHNAETATGLTFNAATDNTAGFAASFTDLVHVNADLARNKSITIHTGKARVVTLDDHDQTLLKAAKMPNVAEWIRNQMADGRHVYMMVGYILVDETQDMTSFNNSISGGGEVVVNPANVIAPGAATLATTILRITLSLLQ
jgi:hypothetical protein